VRPVLAITIPFTKETPSWPSRWKNRLAGIRTSSSGRQTCGAIFDPDGVADEIAKLERKAGAADFWNDQSAAQQVLQRRRRLQEDADLAALLNTRVDDLTVLMEWAEQGEDVASDLAGALDEFAAEVEAGEIRKMLGGEHDHRNAIVSFQPGAGGVDSQDWTEMLLRMYLRWAERRGFTRDVIEASPGEEAGLKSATVTVKGDYVYGLLLAEAGVHRLVRLSPFDTSRRRHTSFASVFVYPEVEDDIEVDLNDEDVKVETYRSGGAGGQHVNKTASAVRVTHLPTGIVVQCQNERSQFKNKATAFKVLKARLYQHLKDEQKQKQLAVESTKKSIDFGSQIRSYVFHPYTIVKDHRTACETANVQAVMDGDIDRFIQAYLTEGQT